MSILLVFVRFLVATATIISFTLILIFGSIWLFNPEFRGGFKYGNASLLCATFVVGCTLWSFLSKQIKKLQRID